MADGISKSWFCVLNNPQEIYKGDPKEIAEAVLAEWIGDSLTRSGAVAYCISALGLIHLHTVFEDNTVIYPPAHRSYDMHRHVFSFCSHTHVLSEIS